VIFALETDAGKLELELNTYNNGQLAPDVEQGLGSVDDLDVVILDQNNFAASEIPLRMVVTWDFEKETMSFECSGSADVFESAAAANLSNITSIDAFSVAGIGMNHGSYLDIESVTIEMTPRSNPKASVVIDQWTFDTLTPETGVHGRSIDLWSRSTPGNSWISKSNQFMKLAFEHPVFYVSPDGSGSAFTKDTPGAVSDALNVAPPGAQILLLPGTYGRIDVSASGVPEQPITLSSASSDPAQYAVIDGGNTTGQIRNQGMRVSDASWLVIEDLKFQNCWQNIIDLDNCSYITVRGCDFREGQRVVFAGAGSHHILLEDNTWKQREEIWYEWSWADVHHSEVEDLRHYNGSLYDGDGYGAAVIRNNALRHVFNGIQIFSSTPNEEANIEIYRNRMDYVRDNAIEPERHTVNLHVYHNEFNQVGSYIFSLLHNSTGYDDPAMLLNGPMYVYGNVGFWDPSDLIGGQSEFVPEYGVVKNLKWFNGEPAFFYHNSWQYKRFGLPNTTDNDRKMLHKNNIGFFEDGYAFRDALQFEEWGNAFDYDFSNQPWQSHLLDKGQEANGIVAPDPGWADPANGDYRLQAGSVCIDAGTVIDGFTQSYDGATPDIGAYEGDKLVEGPPFYIVEPSGGLGYVEKPRITRHRVAGNQLTLFWSWPLDPASVQNDQIIITADGQRVAVSGHSLGASFRELVLTADQNLEGAVLDIEFKTFPIGDNGETATLWGSTL
jgi:hypothetical protein